MFYLYYGMHLVLPHSCVFFFLFNCYDVRDLNIKTSVIIIAQVPLNSCFCLPPPPPKKIFSQLCKFDCYFLVLSVVPQLLYKLVANPCVACDKFVFENVIIIYYYLLIFFYALLLKLHYICMINILQDSWWLEVLVMELIVYY